MWRFNKHLILYCLAALFLATGLQAGSEEKTFQNTPELWISGPDTAVAPGTPFLIHVNVGSLLDQVDNLFGVSFELRYSSVEHLEFVQPFGLTEGDFLQPDVYTFFRHDEQAMAIQLAVSRKRGAPGQNGEGEILSLPFRFAADAPELWKVCFVVTTIFANDPDGNQIQLEPGPSFCVTVRPPTLDVFPNPFTPNGDGHNDELIFEREGGIPDTWKIQIMDRTGRVLRTLIHGQDRWDGTDETGRRVMPGAYLYAIRNGQEIIRRGVLGIIR